MPRKISDLDRLVRVVATIIGGDGLDGLDAKVAARALIDLAADEERAELPDGA